jgi:flagellar hook-length control protein FliK
VIVAPRPADTTTTSQATQSGQPAASGAANAAQSQQASTGGSHTGTGSNGHNGSDAQTAANSSGAQTNDSTSGSGQTSSSFSLDAATQASATTTQAAQTSGAVARTTVTLQDAADTVRGTFTAMNQAGVSTARISLSPAALGGIKITLSQTSAGLIARVVADHPEATQTLQQAAGDLKRTLEANGTPLLRLDISSNGDQSLSGRGSDQEGTGTSSGADGADGGAEDSVDTADGQTGTTSSSELTIQLTSGSLVNVLA